MNKIIFVVLVFTIFTTAIYSQTKTDSSDFESNPQFRSVQLDASSLVFVTKIGAAIDYDLFSNHNKTKTWQSLGLRLGVDRIWKGTPGGPVSGSPFTHLNVYARLSFEGKLIRLDTYAGGAYQFGTYSIYSYYSDKKEKIYLKLGVDLKIKLTPYLGLLVNGAMGSGESYLGLGLFISYNNY